MCNILNPLDSQYTVLSKLPVPTSGVPRSSARVPVYSQNFSEGAISDRVSPLLPLTESGLVHTVNTGLRTILIIVTQCLRGFYF